MVWGLRGKVHKVLGNKLILNVGDIYFEIIVPFKHKFEVNSEIFIHIQTIYNENGFFLYGFLDENEKVWFNELIKIPGIGPNLAINIISQLNLSEFKEIVIKEDITTFSKLKGIGKKIAQKIINEMKEKAQILPSDESKFTQDFIDALNILLSLGVDYKTAKNSLISIIKEKGNLGIEELVKSTLSKIKSL
ncbi:MAG: Holliday junction branch migration protein RuvA [candidate division WOR-3 bacterium]|nr:Holliday junction branch migration protein RuvA [candidate division WOR-3 bacterium]MCX7947440.1 Holliday junction branch migration protein RuvA [candidate division WOR-3 bacterium]MDW8150600.1 Holliday junction branch migration protein RuvA [candidate division WOR-3 bacterium]